MFVVLPHPIAMNTANQSLPCQREGDRDSGGGIAFSEIWGDNPSALRAPYGPPRRQSLLHALAKNMPQAYFLNASRPFTREAFGSLFEQSSNSFNRRGGPCGRPPGTIEHGYEIIDETISMHIITGDRQGRPYSVSCFFDHPCL